MGPGWGDEMAGAAARLVALVMASVFAAGFAVGWFAKGCEHYPRIVWQAKSGAK